MRDATQPKYSSRMAAQDSMRLKMAYIHLHDALNELQQVWHKDNVVAHMVRQIGAMEDTLFEYVTPSRRAK